MHLNIRSIFLERLKIKFPIIGISETWLDDSFHCVDIPGYNFCALGQALAVAVGTMPSSLV